MRAVVEAAQQGARLDLWLHGALSASLGPLSKAAVRRAIVGGAVRVDGQVVRGAGRLLRAGQVVLAAIDRGKLGLDRPRPCQLTPGRVLFEDAWLLALDKPAGLPTVPTADARRDSLVRLAELWLATREGGSVPARLGVHQRLDAETTGVVLFTKSREADASLARAFEQRSVEKVYVAVARRPRRGSLPQRLEGSVDLGGRVAGAATPPAASRSRSAVTDVRVLRGLGPALLVEARPRTGRKHQIRIHLARAGAPLLGDARYGGPMRVGGIDVPRVMLHAARLALTHPVTGVPLVVESPWPDDFSAAIDGLASRLAGPGAARAHS